MVGLGEIAAGFEAGRQAIDMIKGIKAVADKVQMNEIKSGLLEKVYAAQEALMAAQQLALEMQARIVELEAKDRAREDWASFAAGYELADAGQGAVAYRPRSEAGGEAPTHWLCPNCFAREVKSFMRKERAERGDGQMLCCTTCGHEPVFKGARLGPSMSSVNIVRR